MGKLTRKCSETKKKVLTEIKEWEEMYRFLENCIIFETIMYENEYGTQDYILEVARTEHSNPLLYRVKTNEHNEITSIIERPKTTIADMEKALDFFLERTDENLRPRILSAVKKEIHGLYKYANKLK